MSVPAGGRGGAASRQGRDRWRSDRTAARRPRPASRTPRRLGWTLASLAALAALVVLVILPLFARRTAVVLLSIDDYENGLLSAVPFGAEDLEALAAVLDGRLSPRVTADRGPLALDEYHTADAMRTELGPALRGLPLGRGDALVAVIRGQTLVAPGPNLAPQACLLAEDVNLGRAVPAEIVPCRDLFATIASSAARTTLIVLDMGDLRWDPRLGVATSLVPALLDEECRQPLASTAGDCWVLGSHDVHEFSGVSLDDRRSLFLRAVELALAGRADDPTAGGDGDGEVEVHEMARFVNAWTSGWAKRESGGDVDQRPVLWKLGTGRVPLGQTVKKDVPLIRVGRARPPTLAALQAENPPREQPESTPSRAAAPAPADAVAPTTNPAGAGSVPPAAPAPAPRPGVWEFIDRLADDGGGAGECRPVDYAPHLWRETVAAAAAAAATPRDGSALAGRADRIERLLDTALESFLLGDRGQNRFEGRETPLARLADARRRAAPGVAVAWRNGDETVRAALAARNSGVELAAAAVDYFGGSAGSPLSRPLVRSLPPLLDAIAGLHEELRRLASSESSDATDALAQRAAAARAAERQVRQEVQQAGEDLIRRIARDSTPLPAAEVRWFAASRLPGGEQRRRLAEAVAKRLREAPAEPAAAPPADAAASGAAAEKSPAPRPARLALGGPTPPVSADRGPAGTGDRRNTAWKDVGDRLDLMMRLLTIFGPSAATADPDQAVKAFHEAASGSGAGGDASAVVAAAARAGRALASALAKMPGDIDTLLRSASGSAPRATDPALAIDALLRLADPRDAARVPPDALGWVPRVRVAVPLRLAVTATDEPLEVGRPRRVTVALQSGGAFPDAGELSVEFDQERLKIRLLGGAEIQPRKQLRVADLSDRTRLVLLVEPRRQVAAGDAERAATIRAELAVGPRRDHGEKRLQLPAIERLAVDVRGRTGTVEGGAEQAGGWRRVAVDPLPAGDGETASEQGTAPPAWGVLRLRPFPGQVTAWELRLANQSGERRAIDVDLVATGTAVADADDADSTWRSIVANLQRGQPLPAAARILATSGPLVLPASEDLLTVHLPEPRPEPAGNAPGDGTPRPGGMPLGETLALVIRDRAAEPPAAKGGDQPVDAPAVRPPAKRRIWLVRLPLTPKRPKSYLAAQAVWSMDDRSIAIAVEPLRGDPAVLPEGEVGLRATQVPRADPNGPQPILRILEAKLSGGRPKASLRADWNGGESQPAELAIEVDGYPRAFVFRVDTRPVMAGVEQRPQRDWRHLSFLRPTGDYQAFRPGGDAAVPLGLAVDVPEDMLGGGNRPLEVVLREVRQRSGGVAADEPRPAWATTSDRQVDYTTAPASAPATFAVRTAVGDWNFPLRTPGFNDVDVVVEARLRLPDSPRPDIAKRVVVFDGSAPQADVPPRARVEKGKVATIDVECDDGDRNTLKVDGRRPGASGAAKVEWGIDTKRNGQPEAWQAVRIEGSGRTRLRIPTEALPIGTHAVFVRVTDGVGLTSVDRKCELDVVEPRDPAAPSGGDDPR